jgi:hypothetical protein
MVATLQGDMATYYAEAELDNPYQLDEEEFLETYVPQWETLINEVAVRELDV